MKESWSLIFHEDPARLLMSVRGRSRDQLLRELDRLARDPFRRPDAYRTGASGRKYSIRYFGALAIAYWLDAFPEEIRVVSIEPWS